MLQWTLRATEFVRYAILTFPGAVVQMQPAEYKAICQRPDVFQRLTLDETIRVLRSEEPELVPILEREMSQPPVPKPLKHEGDWTTDFFRIDIGMAEAEAITSTFLSKEAEAVSPEGNITGAASHYASLVDQWSHYIDWLADGAV